jgi:transcriptional regulator with XRE-family HTH domain
MLLRQMLGHRLRELRTARGLTLRELARASRVSLAHLSEIERGRTEPSSELLAAICAALGVQVVDLLEDVVVEARGARVTELRSVSAIAPTAARGPQLQAA